MTDPDLIVPEPPAKLFRAQTTIRLPGDEWSLVLLTMLVPVRDGDKLLGFARVERYPDQSLLKVHAVLDYESSVRLDVEVDKAVYLRPTWQLDTDSWGPGTISLLQFLVDSAPGEFGEGRLIGEVL
jgi:hypothetical protein